MKKSLKYIWNDPVWSKVIAVFIAYLIAYFWSLKNNVFKGRSFLDTFLLTLNYPVRIYFILLGFILWIVLSMFRKWSKKNNSQFLNGTNEPFLKYTLDEFGTDHRKWTWRYEWDFIDQHYNIVNITPICAICNSPLNFDAYSNNTTAACSNCRIDGKNPYTVLHQLASDVKNVIIKNIKTGSWAKR